MERLAPLPVHLYSCCDASSVIFTLCSPKERLKSMLSDLVVLVVVLVPIPTIPGFVPGTGSTTPPKGLEGVSPNHHLSKASHDLEAIAVCCALKDPLIRSPCIG